MRISDNRTENKIGIEVGINKSYAIKEMGKEKKRRRDGNVHKNHVMKLKSPSKITTTTNKIYISIGGSIIVHFYSKYYAFLNTNSPTREFISILRYYSHFIKIVTSPEIEKHE